MEMIESYILLVKKNNFFVSNRNHQNISWLKAIIEKNLYDSFYKNNKNYIALKKEIELLKNNETTPFSSAKKLLKNYNG